MEDNIITEGNERLAKLYKFSSEMIYLGPAMYNDRLELFEQKIGHTLPDNYIYT